MEKSFGNETKAAKSQEFLNIFLFVFSISGFLHTPVDAAYEVALSSP